MRVRYGLAAAFVAVVAALIFVRDEGYLGGRTTSGPLSMDAGTVNGESKPGQTEAIQLGVESDDDPVEIQRVRPAFLSPGLEFRAARLGDAASAGYPRDGPLLVGSDYNGDDPVFVGLRAEKPGVYYALGLIVDYRRGGRRFRAESPDQALCIAVGTGAECEAVTLPDTPLAELGGASRVGRRAARITLANVTNRTIEVAELASPSGPATPARFGLAGRGGRTVKVELACDEPVESLQAEVDGEPVDVPLSVPLQGRC